MRRQVNTLEVPLHRSQEERSTSRTWIFFFAILIFSVHFSQKYFFINFKTRCTKTLLFTKKHYCFFSLSKSTTIVFYYKAVPNSQTY